MDPPRSPSPPPEPPNRRNWPQKIPQRGRTQLRNRRCAALRELIKEGDYFSEERMRLRAPRLFHHYIGRFRQPKNPQNHPRNAQNPQNHPKNPQIHPQNPQIHAKNPQIHPEMPQNHPKNGQNGPRPGLRELLLTALEEGEAEDDEDEEDEDGDDEDEDEEQLPDAAEQELLRLEFTSRMHQRFLEGLDGDFDYSHVDADAALDALDLLCQDLEDRYFDEEEPGPAPPLI